LTPSPEPLIFKIMASTFEEASKAAFSLPSQERAALAHALIHSLDDAPSSDLARAWDNELKARLEAVKSGDVEERDAFAVLSQLRAKYE